MFAARTTQAEVGRRGGRLWGGRPRGGIGGCGVKGAIWPLSPIDASLTVTTMAGDALDARQDTSRREIERASRPRGLARQEGHDAAERQVQHHGGEQETEQFPGRPTGHRLSRDLRSLQPAIPTSAMIAAMLERFIEPPQTNRLGQLVRPARATPQQRAT